ncbi:MAG: beta-N-acetylhexosaminidase [Alistipes sp.]|nr:beta-N-acetylhexosaminidase [Alistipes sp.]
MKYLLLTYALLISQCACANNKTTAKSEKGSDTVKVVAPPPAPLFTDIIPQPLSIVKGEGRFTIDERTAILHDKELAQAADYLRLYLPIERTSGSSNNAIQLALDKTLGKEEYSLKIDKKGVAIRGGDYGGVFNAIQSLLQLLPHAVYSKSAQLPMEVSYIEVKDAPQYHYRGFLLDVARTFQPVHEVKRVLDYMAFCKMNKLHLHLIDNPAWRIEIKKYPQLAQEGGFRGGDSRLHPIYGRFNQRYGGFYTQDELRDIVAYAAQRNIEVIPEIDMPGHSKALGAIMPEILCNYTPKTSHTNGIDTRNVWCVAKENNYAIIEDIVKELVTIFPSEYLHIGGDEVSFSQWKQCPDCQRLMAQKGLSGGEQLEQHFLNRVSKILEKYNRKAVVWDEAVDGGLLPKTTMVTGWRGVKQCLSTTAKGYPTIIMPASVFYLDKRQSTHERGHLSSKGVSLRTICDFSFENAGFTAEQRKNIAGIEAAFWSEIYLANINPRGHFSDYLEYMIFPRIFGVAEVAWSKERRSYDVMYSLLKENFYRKLHCMSATFRLESPTIKVEKGKIFASTSDGSQIYYKDIRTNKTQEYKVPLNADMAPFVTLHSRLMTGYSNSVGTPSFYLSRTPEVAITSSMPFSKNRSAERCATYKTAAYTTRCAKAGDWVEFRFTSPLECSYLKVATGYAHLHRCLIYKGHVEVCYDGESFVKAGNLSNGAYELRPKKRAIHALRIVATGISDAENKVIIQPLVIK